MCIYNMSHNPRSICRVPFTPLLTIFVSSLQRTSVRECSFHAGNSNSMLVIDTQWLFTEKMINNLCCSCLLLCSYVNHITNKLSMHTNKLSWCFNKCNNILYPIVLCFADCFAPFKVASLGHLFVQQYCYGSAAAWLGCFCCACCGVWY